MRSILLRAVALFACCMVLFALGAGRSKPTAPLTAVASASTAVAEPTASTGGLVTASLPKARFTSGTTVVTLPIEVPPEHEYPIGLSGRRSLAGRGMLFAFPEGTTVAFWMKDTHLDLDIAFVDAGMHVVDVRTMRADTLETHHPAGSYVAAIEAPAGWYAANGVKVGAQVTLDVDLKAATGR